MIMITLFVNITLFNVETIYSIQVSYDTPTIPDEKKFAYVESDTSPMYL